MKHTLKIILRILASLLILAMLLVMGGYLYLKSTTPQYDGEISMEILDKEVDIYFDDYGIPHIVAEEKTDAYRALGYVHASERMFQIEMMRRVGSGRLSEILGEEFIETDKLFRGLLPQAKFEAQAKKFERDSIKAWYKQTLAYLEGVNQWISEDHTVPEFLLLGMKPDSMTINDIQAISGYMAYSFGLAQRTDPLVNWIQENLGEEHLKNMGLDHFEGDPYIPTTNGFDEPVYSVMNASAKAINQVPLAQWHGSNSWVVSGSMTKSGMPILCNDTHIGYSVPQTWYESHIRVGDFELYGNFLPGIPFALVGHNDYMAWGITMLEQNDMDFYAEKFDDEKASYLHEDIWIGLHANQETIAIKGKKDTVVSIRRTHHGPIVNDVYEVLPDEPPLSLWWDYARFDNNLLYAFYKLNNCNSIDGAATAASMIHGPGLNLTYGDVEGNIAWWACAKLQKRTNSINTKLILDGTTKEHEPTGYYPFSKNPHSINPPWGFVYSANDQPGPIDSVFIQGYFKPHHRADRIKQLIPARSDWTLTRMKAVVTDVNSPLDAALYKELCSVSGHDDLPDWDGTHEVNELGPTIYYRALYHTLHKAMADELGEERFEVFLSTHWMKRAYADILMDENNPWWDDVSVDGIQTRESTIKLAVEQTIDELAFELGSNMNDWTWDTQHKLHLKHSFSESLGPFGFLLNSEPVGARGGHETLNQSGFKLTGQDHHEIGVGSQMRIICDLSDPRSSVSISPAGQSGHFLSPYYMDEFAKYCSGEFRPQLQYNLQSNCANHLKLSPSPK